MDSRAGGVDVAIAAVGTPLPSRRVKRIAAPDELQHRVHGKPVRPDLDKLWDRTRLTTRLVDTVSTPLLPSC